MADSLVLRDHGIEVVEAPEVARFALSLLIAADACRLRAADDGCIIVADQVRYRPLAVEDEGRVLVCRRED